MAGRQLTAPYAAYRRARVPAYDARLAEVGPGTPAGEYLRRFWQPVVHAADLRDLPVAVRILGEDLVAFRDKSGRIGLLHRHCAHRGTSLEFGVVAERGIRCCYHGWQFDVDGCLLEAPAEPPGNPYVGRLHLGAYPVRESHGLVFAYLGPPDRIPPFPLYDSYDLPGITIGLGEAHGVGASNQPCNWLQMMDNSVDQPHEAFLHARHSGPQFLDDNRRPVEELAAVGEPDWWATPIGIACHEVRRLGPDVWVRSMELLYPNAVQVCRTPVFPARFPEGCDEITTPPYLIRWKVPVDDTNTLNFSLIFYRPGEAQDYVSKPTPAARSIFGQRPHEEQQRFPGDYEAQVGQRPIAVHATEHLGASDRGVAMYRRALREGIEAVERGEDPQGIDRARGGPVPTYSRETLMRVPPPNDPATDAALLKRLSREVFERAMRERGGAAVEPA